MTPDRAVLVFLDGVGLGPADPERNALAVARLPVIRSRLDGRAPTLEAAPFVGVSASLAGLDARLGVDGLPQSGTGQTALLTGINAPREFGRHFGPWVPAALRPVLRQQSLLARARNAGHPVAFANAYPEEVVALAGVAKGTLPSDTSGKRRRRAAQYLNAGPPLAAAGAGVLNRHTAHLARGDAVASEITNDGWRDRLHRDVPSIEPLTAGHNLAAIANGHTLTLFAHYTTDYVGHRGRLSDAVDAMERVDAFLGGLLDRLEPNALLMVVSDHGNLEDSTTGHTTNLALALFTGPGHEQLARTCTALTDVTPTLLSVLGVSAAAE